MMKISQYVFKTSFFLLILTNSALAQITPDSTLPNNSVIDNSQPRIDRITEGTTTGNNLFHSFSQFSVDNGTTAHFDNNLTIENIFTRVTGNSISNIDGIIKANGRANLFLINPNGIIFTENARLDVGGSFIGSTANSIKFSDGREFSATNLQDQPLLSINLPTALQFTTNPNPITVQGDGHTQKLEFDEKGEPTGKVLDLIAEGLEVPSGQTLALIGGNLNLAGGNLKAEAGRVELGSIQGEGNVTLTPTNPGWTFSYEGVEKFSDITFEQVASINTTGETGGDVQLQGQNIYFQDGSVILTNTEGSGNAGDVNINATELIELSGTSTKNIPLPSGVLSETTGSGLGGNITVNTSKLVLKDGAQLSSNSFNTGNAGNIIVNSDFIELTGLSPFIPTIRTGFVSQTKGIGNAGNITVNTNNLIIQETAQINSISSAPGKGGNITINALESINLLKDGGLYSNSQGPGDAGDITISTSHLNMDQGGQVGSITFVSGKGGNITINAYESINLAGSSDSLASGIFASALSPPPFVGIVGTGDGGNIKITTSQLNINDGAQVNVSNFQSLNLFPPGIGIPGNISIIANNLNIDNGQITSRANNENGGNINLNVSEISTLSNQSVISATAGIAQEFGNGGNIDFNSQFIIGSGASEITAEAFKGTGGNINLRAEGLFFTPDMIISASSELGADGEIDIRIPDTQPIEGLIERQNLEYPEQIAVGCSEDAGIAEGSFTYTGKGGIPQLATDEFQGDTVLEDLRPLPTTIDENINATIPPEKPAPQPIKEAQGWRWKDEKKDTVIFITNSIEINPQSSSSSGIYCNSFLP